MVIDLLRETGLAVGFELSVEQLGSFSNYLVLLEKWNRRINLTGTRDERELVVHHVMDSLALVKHVPVSAVRLIDVGSGAGFPGVVVAVMRPALGVTCLEPNRKKHAFLATARRELGLRNLEPLPQRLEEHRGVAGFRPYDVAVSRATFAVPEWLERGSALVRPGGVVLAMEGLERRDLPAGATRHPYDLGNRTRAIIESPVPE